MRPSLRFGSLQHFNCAEPLGFVASCADRDRFQNVIMVSTNIPGAEDVRKKLPIPTKLRENSDDTKLTRSDIESLSR